MSAAGEDLELVDVVDPDDGRRWRIDVGFLTSTWECRWGCDCVGILDEPAPELAQGCCSVGAELLDRDEAMQVAALALTLDPGRFQYHGGPDAGLDAYFDADVERTRVIDGACVFLNRPGFAGGAGCALHLAALDAGESPTDAKPAICWQLPLKVVETVETVETKVGDKAERDVSVSILRRWQRDDWGPGGADMAWVCTETAAEPSAYVGGRPVIESLAEELEALLGVGLFDAVRSEIAGRTTPARPDDGGPSGSGPGEDASGGAGPSGAVSGGAGSGWAGAS